MGCNCKKYGWGGSMAPIKPKDKSKEKSNEDKKEDKK